MATNSNHDPTLAQCIAHIYYCDQVMTVDKLWATDIVITINHISDKHWYKPISDTNIKVTGKCKSTLTCTNIMLSFV